MTVAQDQELVDRFEDFFQRYCGDEVGQLAQNYPQDQKSLEVDWQDLYRYDPDFADEYIEHPNRFREAAEEALHRYELPIDVSLNQAHVRISNLTEQTEISSISSNDLNRLISLTGIVENAYTSESVWQEAHHVCQRCGTGTVVPQPDRLDTDDLEEPYQCPSCERSGPFEPDPEKSEFIDRQRFELRETPVGDKMGDDIETITVFLEDDLAGEVAPGDVVTVVGVPRPTKPGVSTSASIADKYVEADSIDFPDPLSEITVTEEDKRDIVRLASESNIYDKMVASLAPSVYGYEREKLALILQLFGGVTKHLPDGTRVRGDMHTLLIGDPGCAKTELLEAQSRIAPKSLHTNGEQTTSAGLTASAERTKGGSSAFKLKAGPVVLADNGHVSIDDLDDMRPEYRSALNEPMSKQTVSASKGDVNAQLKARASITAAANPKYGRFDDLEPIGEQLDLEPGLFTRFDLVFMITDQADEKKDQEVAEHILQANYAGELQTHQQEVQTSNLSEEVVTAQTEEIAPEIDPILLQKYIAYAQRNCFPTMSEKAREAIRDFYVELRSKGADEDAPVPVTARKLEALVRLAEASARVRLADQVTQADAERVIDLVRTSLQDIGVDPETGEFDADVVEKGTSKNQRDQIKNLRQIIETLEKEHELGAPVDVVVERASAVGLSPKQAKHEIRKLKHKGEIYEPSEDYLRTT